MSHIESLVSDINNLFTDGHALGDKALEQIAAQLSVTLGSRLKEAATVREPTLRMSNIGKPLRQLWGELHKVPSETLSASTRIKFLYGAILEDLILFLAKESGHEVTRQQEEVSVDGIKGHIDGFIDGVLVDVKSASSRSFDKFASGGLIHDDPFGYIPQLSGYKTALSADRSGFLAIDKSLGKIAFLEASTEYDIHARIALVREAVASPTPPEKCYPAEPEGKSGNEKLGIGCSYCSIKEWCWADANDGKGLRRFNYARGPVWLTKVVKEPKVFEINTQ